MHNKMKRTFWNRLTALLLTFIIAFTASGCSLNSNTNPSPAPSENAHTAQEDNEAFAAFVNELFCDIVSGDTLTLHAFISDISNFGIEDYEVTLGRYDLEHLENVGDITECLTTLNSFQRDTLSPRQQITYDHLQYYLTTELEYSDLSLYDSPLSPTIGIQVQLPLILAEYTFAKKTDIEDYILLVEDVDDYMSNLVEYEKLRANAGYFMEDTLADQIIAQCQTFIDTAADGYLITTFQERIDAFEGLTAAEIADYKVRNYTAVTEHMVKGYAILKDGLTALKGTNRYAGGLAHYPEGKTYFEYLLKRELGWNRSVEQLDALLTTYLSAYMLQMQRLLLKDSTLSGQFETFTFSLTDPTGILEDLKTRIVTDYPEIPPVNYEIKYIDEALQEYVSPAMYFLPQIDDLSVNSIYINPAATQGDDLYPTLAHEGYPGHLYQTQYFAATNPDWIRYLIEPGGYVEGWATYVEVASYAYAQTGNADLNALQQINYATILCLYGKVDIGINYLGWTATDVYNFIRSYGFSDMSVAEDMYYAMVSEPANYCQYVLGFLALNELKAQAQSACGTAFNLKNFHQYILDMGPVPFDLLEAGIDQWAAAQQTP